MCIDRISAKDNLVELSALLDRLFSACASGVRAQKKRASDQRVNKTFDRQGFKTQANNVLLWLRVSAVSRESNSTAELTLCIYMYIDTAAPELQLNECAL